MEVMEVFAGVLESSMVVREREREHLLSAKSLRTD